MTNKKRAITVDDLTSLEIYSDPQFTPSGNAYSFISTRINEKKEYESHIYFQKVSNECPIQWTFHQKKDSHPRFSPDGNKLVFQSTRSGLPQIWLLDTNGGEAQQITFFEHGAVNPHWSKDGKYIIFNAPIEKDAHVNKQREPSKKERQKIIEEKKKKPLIINRLKHKSDAKGFHDHLYTQIVLYDVEQERFSQLTGGEKHHLFEDISPDGRSIIFSANLNEDEDYELMNDLHLLHLGTRKITKLTKGNGSYGSARFSPSGRQIAYIGHDYAYKGATLTDLFVKELESGKEVCLSKDWDIQIGDHMISDTKMGESSTGPVWSNNEEEIFFIGTDDGTTKLYKVNLQAEFKTLYENNNHLFGFSYNRNTEAFILGISTPTDPGNFFLLKNDKLTKLTHANSELLSKISLSQPEEITIQTDDNLEIQGWILRPYQFNENKKYPFILEVHGGPHAMYGQTFFHEMQLLAAKGYVVLYTNPRGSHGYGQKFVDAVRSDYGGHDYLDLMTAVDFVLEKFQFIDKDRLGVTGGSYGGFMTNWIVGHTDRFKAAVTQRSISNWLSFYGVSDIGYFFTKWELGFNLLEDPKKLWEFSPLKYADNIKTPLLILHGEQDLRCPIEQAEQLFITLKHARKEVEFVRFPVANHELSRSGDPQMRMERLKHIIRWFQKYL